MGLHVCGCGKAVLLFRQVCSVVSCDTAQSAADFNVLMEACANSQPPQLIGVCVGGGGSY